MTVANAAINTLGDVLGQPLNTANFIRPGFSMSFATLPEWAKGKAEPLPTGTAPPPLTDPGFVPRAGYAHAQASPSVGSYVKPGDPYPAFSWLPDELAPFPTGDAIRASGFSPFSVANGILTISAQPTPVNMLPWLPLGYPTGLVSGAMCSYPNAQQYGYFEIRAKLPTGRGLWPAFWLLPANLQWPPEIDGLETIGPIPNVIYTTVHDAALKTATDPSTQVSYATNTVDLSQAFHRFGIDWTPTKLCWYLDRQLVFSQPTPANCHQPFFWLIDLAVGGPTSWPGAPDATTVFPAHLQVAEVNVWERASYA